MSDMNTSRFVGAPCHLCGEDAITVETVAEGSSLKEVALCARCSDEQITLCPACEQFAWTRDCTRIGRELYCDSCSAKHPVIVGATMAAILADEQDEPVEADYQQAMNQVRR